MGRRKGDAYNPSVSWVEVTIDGALRFARAAWVEADDVETLVEQTKQVLAEVVQRPDGVTSGPAEVHEQPPDAALAIAHGQARDCHG
jgi:hypothetical protein